MTLRLGDLMDHAREISLLPADATLAQEDKRPWPVLLLTALGAWLAAIPLIGVVGMVLGGVLAKGFGPAAVGVLVLAGATVVLRSRGIPVFVEQLAIPALLVGASSLGIGLARILPGQLTAFMLCAVMLGLSVAIVRPWLRVLLGAAAAVLAVAALVVDDTFGRNAGSMWVGLHGTLAAWVAAMLLQPQLQHRSRVKLAAWIEAVGAGWLLATLAGLAMWSGTAMLIASIVPLDASGGGVYGVLWPAVSVALCLAASARVAQRWPSLRQPRAVPCGMVLAFLAWLMPALGGVLLALVFTATTRRWRLAAACAAACVWIVSAFYYRLGWPLATKALMLVGAGAIFAVLAWSAQRGNRPAQASPPQAAWRGPAAGIALCALATLAAVNIAIHDKEDLIARGDKVFVELAPVDPRSLMQGDYMRLSYRLPSTADIDREGMAGAGRPVVIVKRDARGVAEPLRIARDRPALAAGEMQIELTPKAGRWILVSDAWFFREGDGARWQAAKYGEFRVLPDGRALLVGLADGQLQSLIAK